MILTFISDTHWIHESLDLPGGNILCHTGDAELNSRSRVRKFAKWMSGQPYDEFIFIPGNHDLVIANDIKYFKRLFAQYGIHMLTDESLNLCGYKFYGMPWTPQFGYWAFMGDSTLMQDKCRKIPVDTDILLTHGPPQGIRDRVSIYRGNVGCSFLAQKVCQVKPIIHSFGHIHESYGYHNFYDILFINAAFAPGYLNSFGEAITVKLDGRKVDDIQKGRKSSP